MSLKRCRIGGSRRVFWEISVVEVGIENVEETQHQQENYHLDEGWL